MESTPARSGGAPRASRVGAAIDVGSNSVHLLVGVDDDSGLRTMLDQSVLLGLGAVVDREGVLPAEATAALVRSLRTFVERAAACGAESITLLATEPLRRAANRSLVQGQVELATGRALHLLTHEDEAYLTLLGVTEGIPPTTPLLIVDVGGGSSEFILAGQAGEPIVGGLPTGSARLTALVAADPPAPSDLDVLRSAARQAARSLPDGRPRRAIMVGGTATNLVRLVPGALEDGRLDGARLDEILAAASELPSAEIARRSGVTSFRARQLAAGAALVEAFLDRYGLAEAEVSARSLREGAILAAERAGPRWRERLRELCAGGSPERAASSGAD